jgi:FAD synthase
VRGQERFDRIEDLVTQMHRDVERVRELLSG